MEEFKQSAVTLQFKSHFSRLVEKSLEIPTKCGESRGARAHGPSLCEEVKAPQPLDGTPLQERLKKMSRMGDMKDVRGLQGENTCVELLH